MSPGLDAEARTMVQVLRDTASLTDGANAERLRMAADIIVKLLRELAPRRP